MSQISVLLEILKDGEIHLVPELVRKVYGMGSPSIARLSARIYELRHVHGYKIESKSYANKGKIWAYQLKEEVLPKFKNLAQKTKNKLHNTHKMRGKIKG